MGQSQHHGSFHHSTLEMSHKCYHNGHNTNPTYDSAKHSRDASHTPLVELVGKSCNKYDYANRRALHVKHLHNHHINGNFSHDN